MKKRTEWVRKALKRRKKEKDHGIRMEERNFSRRQRIKLIIQL